MKNYIFLVFALCVSLFLTSCKSIEFYRSRAVEKARVYALQKLKFLPELKRDYIKYAPPYLVEDRILVRGGGTDLSKNDVMHTCVVWDVPGLDKDVVVCGVSERRLDDWEPIRVVMKNFIDADKKEIAAITSAREYAMQKMLYLTDVTRDRIRFSRPEMIIRTSFDIDTSRLEKDLKEQAKQADREVPEFKFVQYSLVWSSEKLGKKVVITGVANKSDVKSNVKPEVKKSEKGDLYGWMPVFGTLRQESEINK